MCKLAVTYETMYLEKLTVIILILNKIVKLLQKIIIIINNQLTFHVFNNYFPYIDINYIFLMRDYFYNHSTKR